MASPIEVDSTTTTTERLESFTIDFANYPDNADDYNYVDEAIVVGNFTTSTTTERDDTNDRRQSGWDQKDVALNVFGLGRKSVESTADDDDDDKGDDDDDEGCVCNPLDDIYKWDKKLQRHFTEHAFSYRFCFFGVMLMTIYELIQCVTSYRTYFFKFSNWLDIALIFISYAVFFGSFGNEPSYFKKVCAVLILIMAAQTIQLIAKVSILSMSLHMTIFKRVSATFLKTISLYMIMILAFAMSFYTLHNSSEEDKDSEGNKQISFSDPFMAIITTVRMMLSDFDNININQDEYFQGFMFLIFVVFITIVLFNLLNALAISDTHQILLVAELVDTKKRVSILNSYEKLFSIMKLSFSNIFPAMATFFITPNKDDVIKIKRDYCSSDHGVIVSMEKDAAPKFKTLETRKVLFISTKTMRMSRELIEKFLDFVKIRNIKAVEQTNQMARMEVEKQLQRMQESIEGIREQLSKNQK